METEFISGFHLPPGFRFHPSDEELIEHYLLNQLNSRPLPANLIAEIELYNYNPWELPSSFSSPLTYQKTSFIQRQIQKFKKTGANFSTTY